MSIFQIAKKQGWKILLLLFVPYLLILLIGNADWWQVSEFLARTALNRNSSVFTDINNFHKQSDIITSNAMYTYFADDSQICQSATSGSMAESLSAIASTLDTSTTQKVYETTINLNTVCTSAVDLQDHLTSLNHLSSSQLKISPETIQQLNQSDMDETILALGDINQFLTVIDQSMYGLNDTIMPVLEKNENLDFVDPEGTLCTGLQSWVDEEEQISTVMAEIERDRQTLRALNGAYKIGSWMESTGTNWCTQAEEFINDNFDLYTKILLVVFSVWIGGLVGSFLEQQFRRREEHRSKKEK